MTFEEKTEINCRMQQRYDALMREGKQGHYETMFRVLHAEIAQAVEAATAAERERCAKVCEDNDPGDWSHWSSAAQACAAAIRAG